MEKYRPQLTSKDEQRLRIEALSPLVRCYLALGFALKNTTLDAEQGETIAQSRAETYSKFTPLQKAEFINHVSFMSNEGKTQKTP